MADRSIRPFRPEDGEELDLQLWQCGELGLKDWERIACAGTAFTGRRDGIPIVSAGIVDYWHGRSGAWARLSSHVDRIDMIWMHRRILQFLTDLQVDPRYKRVETLVQLSFPEGHRWAKMLSFSPEGVLQYYDQAGNDYVLYARIKRDRCKD